MRRSVNSKDQVLQIRVGRSQCSIIIRNSCGRIKRLHYFFSVGKNRRILKTPLPLFHAARPLPGTKEKRIQRTQWLICPE